MTSFSTSPWHTDLSVTQHRSTAAVSLYPPHPLSCLHMSGHSAGQLIRGPRPNWLQYQLTEPSAHCGAGKLLVLFHGTLISLMPNGPPPSLASRFEVRNVLAFKL